MVEGKNENVRYFRCCDATQTFLGFCTSMKHSTESFWCEDARPMLLPSKYSARAVCSRDSIIFDFRNDFNKCRHDQRKRHGKVNNNSIIASGKSKGTRKTSSIYLFSCSCKKFPVSFHLSKCPASFGAFAVVCVCCVFGGVIICVAR